MLSARVRRPRVAPVALAALVLGGCGGGPALDLRRSPDVRWLERYGPWSVEYTQKIGAVQSSRLPTRELADCTHSYDGNVGGAPARFRSVERVIRRGCREYERAARLEKQITPDRDPGPLLLPIQTALARGDDLFARAAYELERRLQVGRPLPVAEGPSDDSRVDPRLGAAAETIVHRQVEVRCWSEDDWRKLNDEEAALGGDPDAVYAGFVGADADRLHLAPHMCEPLAELAYDRAWEGRRGADRDHAYGVLALAHEANHLLAPAANEAEVECSAVQQVRALARALGIDGAYADALAQYAWEQIYPENDPEYRTPLCRDGGPLDLDRSSSRWP